MGESLLLNLHAQVESLVRSHEHSVLRVGTVGGRRNEFWIACRGVAAVEALVVGATGEWIPATRSLRHLAVCESTLDVRGGRAAGYQGTKTRLAAHSCTPGVSWLRVNALVGPRLWRERRQISTVLDRAVHRSWE